MADERRPGDELFTEPYDPLESGSSASSTRSVGEGESSTSGNIVSTSESTPPRPQRRGGRPSKRPRSSGRPRGRGRAQEPSTSGTSGRGRGRGGGRGGRGGRGRGGRLRSLLQSIPRSLSEEEVGLIQSQQEQRSQQLKNLMSQVDREVLEDLLVEACDKSSALGMDIEHQLATHAGQLPPGPAPEPGVGSPPWCVCSQCREMPTQVERMCCNQPQKCKSLDPIMTFNILNVFNLAINRVVRGDYEGRDDDREEGEEDNASMRHAAYRSFVAWQYYKLGAGNRRVIPSCCVWRIRAKFPSQTGQYTGFLPGRIV